MAQDHKVAEEISTLGKAMQTEIVPLSRIVIISLFLAMVACSTSGTGGDSLASRDRENRMVATQEADSVAAKNEATIKQGREIFTGYCAVCHQVSERMADEDSRTGLVRASTGEKMTASDLSALIRNPPSMMPTMPLEDHQLSALVSYLQSLPEQVIAVSGMP